MTTPPELDEELLEELELLVEEALELLLELDELLELLLDELELLPVEELSGFATSPPHAPSVVASIIPSPKLRSCEVHSDNGFIAVSLVFGEVWVSGEWVTIQSAGPVGVGSEIRGYAFLKCVRQPRVAYNNDASLLQAFAAHTF